MRLTASTRRTPGKISLAAYRDRMQSRLKPAAIAGASKLLDEANLLVPKDTKSLHETGRVIYPEMQQGWDVVAVVGFGGEDYLFDPVYSPNAGKDVRRVPAEYALIVHENWMEVHGKKIGPKSGQPFFLKEPGTNKRTEIAEAIRKELMR